MKITFYLLSWTESSFFSIKLAPVAISSTESSSTQLSLTSFETILLDCIVTAVISVHFLKNIKIGDFCVAILI